MGFDAKEATRWANGMCLTYVFWPPPPLQFVDITQYGTPAFFEHFREHADNTAAWKRRALLTRKVGKKP